MGVLGHPAGRALGTREGSAPICVTRLSGQGEAATGTGQTDEVILRGTAGDHFFATLHFFLRSFSVFLPQVGIIFIAWE